MRNFSKEFNNKNKERKADNYSNKYINNENKKFKEFLFNFVKIECSIDSIIKGTKNRDTRLVDIYNFLKSE